MAERRPRARWRGRACSSRAGRRGCGAGGRSGRGRGRSGLRASGWAAGCRGGCVRCPSWVSWSARDEVVRRRNVSASYAMLWSGIVVVVRSRVCILVGRTRTVPHQNQVRPPTCVTDTARSPSPLSKHTFLHNSPLFSATPDRSTMAASPSHVLRQRVIQIYKGTVTSFPAQATLNLTAPARTRPSLCRAPLPRPRVPARLPLLPAAPAQSLCEPGGPDRRRRHRAGHRARRVRQERCVLRVSAPRPLLLLLLLEATAARG